MASNIFTLFAGNPIGLFSPSLKEQTKEDIRCRINSCLSDTSKETFFRISEKILEYVQEQQYPCFVLPELIFFILEINRLGILENNYKFNNFEWWLLEKSGLSLEEEMEIRSKIGGKKMPRGSYQIQFPVSGNTFLEGSHIVSAHPSPDLDSAVSSFCSWLDAFTAKISTRIHIWNLPGGVLSPQDEAVFNHFFGVGSISVLCRAATQLFLTSVDISEKGHVVKVDDIKSIKEASYNNEFIIISNDDGYYMGEWSETDTDRLEDAIQPLFHMLKRYEIHVNKSVIRSIKTITNDLYKECAEIKMNDPNLVFVLSKTQTNKIESILRVVFDLSMEDSFATLGNKAAEMGFIGLFELHKYIKAVDPLKVIETAEKIVDRLDIFSDNCYKIMYSPRNALKIKKTILKIEDTFVSTRSTYEEIYNKATTNHWLSVLFTDTIGNMTPVGVINCSKVLSSSSLGTVSLRDFSNVNEISICKSLEVVSIIDHHCSNIKTRNPPFIFVSNVEACCVLTAELDDLQYKLYHSEYETSCDKKRIVFQSFLFLSAIFNDTDFLSKYGMRELNCIIKLLDKISEILRGTPTGLECILPISNTKRMILSNSDAYSIYSTWDIVKEKTIEDALNSDNEDKIQDLFCDTKIFNNCAAVGQIKLCKANWTSFKKSRHRILRKWIDVCKGYVKQGVAKLFIQMISTVPGHSESLSGDKTTYDHLDQIWVWSIDMSKHDTTLFLFLKGLGRSIDPATCSTEAINDTTEELSSLLIKTLENVNISNVTITDPKQPTVLVIHVPPTSMNSRKKSITPHIPHLHS